MDFSWSTILDSIKGDQSLETQMAQREMQNRQKMMMDISQEAERRRATKVQEQHQTDTLAENSEYRKAVQAATQQQRDIQEKDRQTTERRNRYNTTHDNLAPGQHVGKDVKDLVSEFEGGGAFTPSLPEGQVGAVDPNSEPSDWIYKKHQAEVAALKAQHDQELRDAADARAKEAEGRDKERLKIAQDAEARQKVAAEDLHRKRQEAAAKAGKVVGGIPADLRQSFNNRVKEIYSGGQATFPWQSDEENQLSATQKAYEEFAKAFPDKVKPQSSGLSQEAKPAAPPPPGGREGGPGVVGPKETPEQRLQRLLNTPTK